MCASEPQAPRGLRLGTLLLGALLCASAFAQQAPSREQELIRRLRQQVQQLQAEQAAQQQAVQRAESEKAQARTQLDAAAAGMRRVQQSAAERSRLAEDTQKDLDTLRTAHAALQAEAERLKTELQARTDALAALRTEQTGLQRNLAQRDAGYAELQSRHATQAQGLQACIANNQALHGLGRELLQRWLDKGVLETTAQVEPLFQFKRVELENLVQGYQDKLDQQALKPAAAAPIRVP
jgi:chromosome segregation ATPase